MKKEKVQDSCENLSSDTLLTPTKQSEGPRRKIVRIFDKWFFFICWIAILIPLLIEIAIIYQNKKTNTNIYLPILIWIVITFTYCFAQSKLQTKSITDSPWYLKPFNKHLIIFHVVFGILLTSWVHYTLNLYLPINSEWDWIIFIIPIMLASETKGSTLFALSLIASILFFNANNYFSVGFSNIGFSFIQTCFISIVTSLHHYSKRRYLIWMERSILFSQCLTKISGSDTNNHSLEEWIAEEIAKRMNFQKVFILLIDDSGKNFEIVGCSCDGISKSDFSNNNFQIDRGISGQVVRSHLPHLARNVNNCSHYYLIEGMDNTRSEFATPIKIQDRIIGVLNIESDRYDDFSLEDIQIITVLADAIALRLEKKYSSLENTDNLNILETISNVSARIRQKNSFVEIFEEFATTLIKDMGVNNVVLYRLAPGTSFPLLPPLTFGEFQNNDYLSNNTISRNSMIFDLINNWQYRYSSDSRKDLFFGYFENKIVPNKDGRLRFVYRENIFSSAFIPLGTVNNRIAIVFINYYYHHFFNPNYRIKIQALANLYAFQLLLVQQKELQESPLFLDAPDYHMRFGVKFLRLSEKLESTMNNPINLNETVKSIVTDLRSITKDVFLEEALETKSFSEMYELERQIVNVKKIIDQSIDRQIDFSIDIDANIFYCGRAINQSIYAIICEAMINAVHHGLASRITISAKKSVEFITISVNDNGKGFNVEKAKEIYDTFGLQSKRGARGIFSRLDAITTIFGAKTALITSKINQGTNVLVEIPLITEI